MASQEERDNFFSLTLLLFRVGNQTLRDYFKKQWPIVYQRVIPGTVPPPWQDTPHDATELKKIQPTKLKFKFRDEETKFNSGNTNDWDFSLLTFVLKYSSLHFVLPSSPEEKALDDLKAIHNKLIGHVTDAAIPNAVFNTAWTDACNALALFGASAADFKSAQDEQLQQTVEKQHTTLQETVEKQHTTLQETVEKQHTTLQETVEKQHTTLHTVEKQNTTPQDTVQKQHETQVGAMERIEQKCDLSFYLWQLRQKYSSTEVQPGDLMFNLWQLGQKYSSTEVQPGDLRFNLWQLGQKYSSTEVQPAKIPAEIIARGPKALKAYEEALESGSTKNRRLLVMVVGPARAGKTSLLKSFNGEEFDPKEDSTDGIQLQHTFCKPQEKCWGKDGGEGISYTNCIVDVICESLRGKNKNLAEASKEAMEKPVESSKSSPKNEDDNDNNDNDDDDDDDDDDHDDKDNHNDDDHDSKAKASKDQIISEKSTTNLPKSIEEKLLVKLKDTESDETKENELYIKTLDFAGQAVYNVIHPIFLTLKAVFILVHNLKNILRDPMKSKVENDGSERELVDPFEMTNLEILELWLSCISSYTNAQRMEKVGKLSLPPVFIVGTHADKVDGGLEAAKQIIREIYTSLSPSKHPSGSHVVRNKIYTVDNSVSGNGEIRDESVRILKADIEKLSKSLPHMNEDIPISWLLFEEELSNLIEKENKKYIAIDEAMEIAIKCKVNTDAESNEFTTLLNYLHDLKTIIYFEETKTVFIDTQWLVSAFTQVIEVRPVEKRDGFDESWDKLEEEGVLERALVEHVWKGLVDEQNTIYSLLLIMEKFSLICRWNTSEGEEVYLVPCMLCNSRKREDITKLLKDQKTSTIVIRFNIPHVSLGIFPRLFVAIAEEGKKEWPNLRQPKLHKNFCRIHNVGKERNLDICVIQSSIRTISVTVCNKHNIDGKRVIEFCQYFRKLLDQIFDDMRRNFPWMQNMKFHHGIFCPVCTRSTNKCKSHGKEGCTRDSCLHFLNEEEFNVDRPECYKDPTNLDNEIEEEAYIYWFPRQARHLQVEKQSQPLEEEFIKEKLDLKSGDKIDDFFGRYEKFALDYQHQVPVSDLEETIRLKHSIGAIIAINISNVPKCGATCFRIGTNYVITNQHVVVEIKDLGIQWSSCYVDFNYGGQGSQPATTFQFNFAPNPELVSSKELDYAILKLNPEGRNLPPSLVDPDSGFNIAPPGRQLQGGECLTFIGHPGGLKKQIDVSCPIKVQQDTQKHLHNDYVFCTIQKAFNHPDIATYDVSTFFKGSSGSPGLLMKEKLLVVLHSGGIPLQGTNKHHVLEYGPLMSSVVKDVMKQINTGTIQGMTYGLDDIFGGSTYSTFNQYP